MGFDFGQAVDTLKGQANKLLGKDIFPVNPAVAGVDIYDTAKKLGLFVAGQGQPWSYVGQDWYKVFPYSFVVEGPQKSRFIYTFPIPPQMMVTNMIPASKATATFGGVVEETSDNVFWQIQIQGTTGVAISRDGLANTQASRKDMANKFRKKLETTGLLSGVASQLNALVGKVGGTADAVLNATSAFKNGDFSAGAAGVTGAINNAILPQQMYSGSGVDDTTNGYTEMQELHRFLFTYSHLKAARPKDFTLKFQNHKTGQEWRVILSAPLSISQSANQPMSYRYSIQLQAWDVQPINGSNRANEIDRFAPGNDLGTVNTVGVSGAYKAFKGFSTTLQGKSKNTVTESFLKPFGV